MVVPYYVLPLTACRDFHDARAEGRGCEGEGRVWLLPDLNNGLDVQIVGVLRGTEIVGSPEESFEGVD